MYGVSTGVRCSVVITLFWEKITLFWKQNYFQLDILLINLAVFSIEY